MEHKTSKKIMTEKAMANSTVMVCYTIITAVLVIAYLGEVLKGLRTTGYFALFTLLAVGPYIISLLAYNKNRESAVLRKFVAYGFAILYTFVMFTSTAAESFVYVVPMYVAIAVYADIRYTVRVGIGVIIVNVLHIVYSFSKNGFTAADVTSLEIRMALLCLCLAYVIMVSYNFVKVQRIKVGEVSEAKKNSDELLEQVMDVSQNMATIVGEASGKMSYLHDSLSHTMAAMQQVSVGTNDTVDAVQGQLEKTRQIQEHVTNVEQASMQIEQDMRTAMEAIGTGHENIKGLVEQVKVTEEAGAKVSESMRRLDDNAKQMEKIINVIEEITEQTSLLALNASIEAARAGEAGRGFAVVASEISSLAGQTSGATVEITEIIENISMDLKNVIKQMDSLVEVNNKQAARTQSSAESFSRIEEVSRDIEKQSALLAETVKMLADANAGIIDNIQTISAITEEVTAHSSETYESSEENDKTAGDVNELVMKLSELAEQLKQN